MRSSLLSHNFLEVDYDVVVLGGDELMLLRVVQILRLLGQDKSVLTGAQSELSELSVFVGFYRNRTPGIALHCHSDARPRFSIGIHDLANNTHVRRLCHDDSGKREAN